jgi:transcriptional regulator with XRE-family HTH domain
MGTNEEKYKTARLMLCRYLHQLAKDKGITQDDIAEKTGFTRNNVSRMLSGKYAPSLDNFIRLAEAVDCYFFVIDKKADEETTEMMQDRWGKRFDN